MNPASASAFVGRAAELQGIADSFRSPNSAGVVLVGPAGIGKTALLQKAISQAMAQFHVIRLRGSAAMSDSPYSALNGLLSELEDEQVAHPVILLKALSALLWDRGAGRQAILAVDNVELLDDSSAMIISQLAAAGVVRVLLTARRFDRADADFMALWRKGSLLRLDVESFSLKESGLFCEGELGSHVSADLVRVVHRLGGGSPKLLAGCIRELQSQGLVVQGRASWVILDGVAVPCGQAAAATVAHIDSLGSACRRTAVLVALSGGLPLGALVRLTSAAAIDALEDAGLVSVDQDLDTTVRCASSVTADGIRMGTSEEDARAAYSSAAGLQDEGYSVSQLPSYHHAVWRQKAGLPLDAVLVARAATQLNDHGKYAAALNLIQDADDPAEDAVRLEAMRARVAMGDYQGFQELDIRLPTSPPTAPEHLIRMLLLRAEVWQRTGQGVPSDLVDQAETLTEGLPTAEGAAAMADEVLVARAELAVFEGRYRDAASMLSARKQGLAPMTNDTLVRIDTLLAETWSMGVQQLDALEMARSTAGFILENQVTARTRVRAYDQIWETHRTGGDIDGALHIRDVAGQRSDESCFAPRSYEEVSRALARAYQGRVEDALRILLPTFDQLQVRDPWGALPAAAAGIAYCYAQQRALQPMIEYLRFSEAKPGTPWKIAVTARYFQLLASSHTENRTMAGQDFLKIALSLNGADGIQYMQMLTLFRAVRLGSLACLDSLGAVAAQLQGPFARLAELYAKGLGSQDGECLLRSMESASAMGDGKLAREAAQQALQAALRSDDRRALRHVQRQVRAVMPGSEEWGAPGAPLTGLTRREREVAIAAAAGATNRSIAADMCVSVRTVEGHLYQVYSKLNVGSRAELTELIPAGQVQP